MSHIVIVKPSVILQGCDTQEKCIQHFAAASFKIEVYGKWSFWFYVCHMML